MVSQTPRNRGAGNATGTQASLTGGAIAPKGLGGSVLMVTQTEKQHGQGVPLRFVEYGQEIASAHEHQDASVAHHTNEVMMAGITPPKITTSTARFWSTPLNNR
jgi:hypothetical protein